MSSGTAPTSYGGTDESDPDTEPRKKSLDELLAETYDAIMAREAAAPPEPQLDYSGMTIEETMSHIYDDIESRDAAPAHPHPDQSGLAFGDPRRGVHEDGGGREEAPFAAAPAGLSSTPEDIESLRTPAAWTEPAPGAGRPGPLLERGEDPFEQYRSQPIPPNAVQVASDVTTFPAQQYGLIDRARDLVRYGEDYARYMKDTLFPPPPQPQPEPSVMRPELSPKERIDLMNELLWEAYDARHGPRHGPNGAFRWLENPGLPRMKYFMGPPKK